MSQTKLLIIGGVAGLAIVALMLYLVLSNIGVGQQQTATLQFWGTFDDAKSYDSAISAFEQQNPGIHIVYRQFNFEDYEKQLIDSFAAGAGPDIWLMHNTWLPKHGDKIQPLLQTMQGQKTQPLTFKDFQDQFVDVAVGDLALGGEIYALPVYVDTLALYYNKDIFNTLGITTPPSTWDEFNDDVEKITAIDDKGNITRSAAAIGTARNINRSTDILSLLMLQSGVKMTDAEHTSATFSRAVEGVSVGETSVQYYADFANPSKKVYTWNDQQHYSIDAFAEGNAAMMFNYSHQIPVLRSKSPRLNFAAAPMPQISGASSAVNFANYWAPTVSKQSKNPVAAWKFLVYLSSNPGASFYLNSTGRPAARRDLIELQKTDPDLGTFAAQSLTARSWYQVDNSAIETIFADMIDEVNYGRASIRDALQSAESKVSVLMSGGRGGP